MDSQTLIGKRVSELRKCLGLNQTEFAKALSIGQQALSMIENGQRDLSEKNIKLICFSYKASYEWLVHGSGEMFNDDGDAQAVIDSVLTSDYKFMRDTLVKLASMDEKYWRMLEEIIEQLKKE